MTNALYLASLDSNRRGSGAFSSTPQHRPSLLQMGAWLLVFPVQTGPHGAALHLGAGCASNGGSPQPQQGGKTMMMFRFWGFVILSAYLFFRFGTMFTGAASWSWSVVYPSLAWAHFAAWMYEYSKQAQP